jgi:hypothetical protein
MVVVIVRRIGEGSVGDEAATLLVTCAAEDVGLIRELLVAQDADVQASPRRQLDGASVTTWVIAATVAIRTMPLVINALRDFLTRNNVREIKFGEVSITNPRPEDTEKLIEVIRDRLQP